VVVQLQSSRLSSESPQSFEPSRLHSATDNTPTRWLLSISGIPTRRLPLRSPRSHIKAQTTNTKMSSGMPGSTFLVYTSPSDPPRRPVYGIQSNGRHAGAHPQSSKPDVITIRLQNIQQQLGMPPIASERDILWIECKVPIRDVPDGWKKWFGRDGERTELCAFTTQGLSDPRYRPEVDAILMGSRSAVEPGRESSVHTNGQRTSPLACGSSHSYDRAGKFAGPKAHRPRAKRGVDCHDKASIYSLDFWTLEQGGNPANFV